MLNVNLCGIELENPLMLAAGILGSHASSMNLVLDAGAGAVVSKSFSKDANEGYHNPTTVEVEGGIINAIGLSSPGVDAFLEELELVNRDKGKSIASIYGANPEEFSYVAEKISNLVDAIELNVSCPHAMEGYGASIGENPELTCEIVSAVKDAVDVPVFAKLTPNVTDIKEIAVAAENGGADGLTLINSLGPGMKIDIVTGHPILSNKFGGMSYDACDIPIIGVGGVRNYEDVVEFLYAGATAVQIGTSIMYEGPDIFGRIAADLDGFLEDSEFDSIEEMVGFAHKD